MNRSPDEFPATSEVLHVHDGDQAHPVDAEGDPSAPSVHPVWSSPGSALMLDFTGRGALFPHWYNFVCLAAEARDSAAKSARDHPSSIPASEALSAILFSALAAEALINELAEAAARNERPGQNQDENSQTLADLAVMLGTVEDARGQIELKYQVAAKVLTGSTFPPGEAPFQQFAALMRLRDELVHPRHRDQLTAAGHVQPVSKIVRDLQQRGLTVTKGRRPGDIPGGMSWLDEIKTPGVAGWAYGAARDIIAAILEMLPDDGNLTTSQLFRDRLTQLP